MIRHHSPAPVSPRRVVILGASGFIGTHLVEHLRAQRIPILALASSQVDLTSYSAPQALRDCLADGDALVFASALTPDMGDNTSTLMRNLAMVEALVSLEKCPIAHVVYLSSDAVYDSADSLVREETRPAPPALYGHMHLLREKLLSQAAGRWGCPLLVLRPTAVYGPGDTHNSYGPNRFFRSAAAQQRISLFGHGEELRDHLLVTDLVRIIGLALAHRSEGLLNVATGRSTSFHALAQLISGMVEHVVAIEHQPRRLPVTHRHFDITALIRALPSFRFTELKEGLRGFLQTQQAVQAA